MGLLQLFTGKPPAELELVGDGYMSAREYGAAKVEYEKALDKAEKRQVENQPLIRRLTEKLTSAREHLAGEHIEEARELISSGEFEDARALLGLSLELSGDKAKLREAERMLQEMGEETGEKTDGGQSRDQEEPVSETEAEEEELFRILTNTLSEEQKRAYQSYGRDFRKGYNALNHGDFGGAVSYFENALEKNPAPDTWIPLELATALMNLGQTERAMHTASSYIRENPESLRSYQLLCDIYWDMEDYEAAEELLRSCPESLKNKPMMRILLGETLYQSGHYEAAKEAFFDVRRDFGDTEIVQRALAKTYEALGDTEAARELYRQILQGCASCGARMDPYIKRRFAELSLQGGDTSTKILEMYLSLVQEDPDNRGEYYARIGEIYEKTGNPGEAGRYFDLSARQRV